MILPEIVTSALPSGAPVLLLTTLEMHALSLDRIGGARADSLLLLLIGSVLIIASFLMRGLLRLLYPRRPREFRKPALPAAFVKADTAAGTRD